MKYMTLAGLLVAILITPTAHAEGGHHTKWMEHHERCAMHKQMHRPGKTPPTYGDVHGRSHHPHKLEHYRAKLEAMTPRQRQAATRASTTFIDEVMAIPAAYPEIERYFRSLSETGRTKIHP